MLTKILVVGGAGFIGSHMVKFLRQKNLYPIVIDNLITGHRSAILNAEFYEGDIANTDFLNKVFSEHQFTAVMHFASFIQVGESVINPQKYYLNNIAATLNLLKVMQEHRVNHFIFSSTAAVYGEPLYTPIDENHPLNPINPYGFSKYVIEKTLADYAKVYDFHYAALRYFNAAGADPEGELSECHEPETHLIPLILKAASQKKSITIYGTDYPTTDGTCIRDYIHVVDLCEAHYLALQYILNSRESLVANLGTGLGYSVQEVINVAKKITQKEILTTIGPRRAGDPAILVADPRLAFNLLNWRPRHSDLKILIQHVFRSFNGLFRSN